KGLPCACAFYTQPHDRSATTGSVRQHVADRPHVRNPLCKNRLSGTRGRSATSPARVRDGTHLRTYGVTLPAPRAFESHTCKRGGLPPPATVPQSHLVVVTWHSGAVRVSPGCGA